MTSFVGGGVAEKGSLDVDTAEAVTNRRPRKGWDGIDENETATVDKAKYVVSSPFEVVGWKGVAYWHICVCRPDSDAAERRAARRRALGIELN